MAEDFDATWMDYLPLEAQLGFLRQTPEELAGSWAPEDSGVLPDVSDPDLAGYTALGSSGARRELLERQLAMAQQLQSQDGGNYTSPWGAALGGLGGLVNRGLGAYQQKKALEGLGALTSTEESTRARFARGARSWTPEQAANLGILSGDPVLGAYGRSQQTSVKNMDAGSLRALALEQANRRLANQEQEAERKAQTGKRQFDAAQWRNQQMVAGMWKNLGLREQEAAQQRAGTQTKTEGELRREFNALPEVKEFGDFDANYQGLLKASKNPTGIGGTTAIFSFMKLIDPGVAVMEGDVDRIKAAGGPASQFAGLYERALTGTPIPKSVIDDMVKQARELHSIRAGQVKALERQYGGIAQQSGADPARVVVPRGLPDTDLMKAPGATPAGGPQPSEQDRAAMQWLQANPNDPRAPAIRKRLQEKGLSP